MADPGSIRVAMTAPSASKIADAFARLLLNRLEQEGELPLPIKDYDVVVDDPELSRRYEFTGIEAISARHAGTLAYRDACRAEGFRVMTHMPPGDEVLIEGVASGDCAAMYAVVHRPGRHPDINYVLLREGGKSWQGYERTTT